MFKKTKLPIQHFDRSLPSLYSTVKFISLFYTNIAELFFVFRQSPIVQMLITGVSIAAETTSTSTKELKSESDSESASSSTSLRRPFDSTSSLVNLDNKAPILIDDEDDNASISVRLGSNINNNNNNNNVTEIDDDNLSTLSFDEKSKRLSNDIESSCKFVSISIII